MVQEVGLLDTAPLPSAGIWQPDQPLPVGRGEGPDPPEDVRCASEQGEGTARVVHFTQQHMGDWSGCHEV